MSYYYVSHFVFVHQLQTSCRNWHYANKKMLEIESKTHLTGLNLFEFLYGKKTLHKKRKLQINITLFVNQCISKLEAELIIVSIYHFN